MDKPSMAASGSRAPRRILPFLPAGEGACFVATYALSGAGIVALALGAATARDWMPLEYAAMLWAAAWAGRIAPFFPVGILSVFFILAFPATMIQCPGRLAAMAASVGAASSAAPVPR